MAKCRRNREELIAKQPKPECYEGGKKAQSGKKQDERARESMKEVTAGGLFDQGRAVLI